VRRKFCSSPLFGEEDVDCLWIWSLLLYCLWNGPDGISNSSNDVDFDLNFTSEDAAFLRSESEMGVQGKKRQECRGFAKHSLINFKHLFCKITSDLRSWVWEENEAEKKLLKKSVWFTPILLH
jgi:hypothetical protein